MDSKIFGIPLVLIVLVGAIVVAIDVPMVLLHRVNQETAAKARVDQLNTKIEVETLRSDLMKPTPTATPEATITPFTKFRPGVASPSGLTPTPKK